MRKGVKRAGLYRCERCHTVRQSHGPDGECPDGGGVFHQRNHPRRVAASQSFTADEVDLLLFVFRSICTSTKPVDFQVIKQKPAMQKLLTKAARMKQRIEIERKAKAAEK